MFNVIAISIIVFLIIFIYFFSRIYFEMNRADGRSRSAYGLLISLLMFFAWIVITLIYLDLSIYKRVGFVDYYQFPIDGRDSIVIGAGDEDGNSTHLINRLAVENHLLLTLDKGEDSEYIGTLELLTNRRKAIVNSTLLRNRSESEDRVAEQLRLSSLERESNRFINSVKVRDGDFIRIGFSNYKIYRDGDSIILDNISLSPLSFTNIFYLYTTTTYPDVVVGDRTGVVKSSLFWLWFVTSLILLIFSYILFSITTKITTYVERKQWAIVHPILYFTIILEFLFLASYINFTVMYFYQFNIYAKGSLFTEIVVFFMMVTFGIVSYLIYRADDTLKASKIAFVSYISLLSLIILIFKGYIYSSNTLLTIPKSMIVFLGEQTFIFAIFMLFVNFLKYGENYIFLGSSREHINNKIYKHIIFSTIFMLGAVILLAVVGLIKEGQGMVFIESTKFFIFLLVTLLFHHSFRKNSFTYLLFLGLFFTLLLGTIFIIKDKGSILQVFLALSIIYILFKDNFNIKIWWFLGGVAFIVALGVIFYHIELKDNVRFAMWREPFAQDITPSTQYFLYRYEQIARGLFLIKNSTLFSSNFVDNSFLPLPAIHTDFIFAFFSQIFGGFGVLTLLFALFLLSLSFKKGMEQYSSESEVFKFIYGINSVFIAYIL
ncbi:MAG: FtsW/RodA/SpoVE family cell cycle protein, partial [Epsilonproteobacteria bacterium]|nr:FtsW/RodA/SpoVE family cell cycle protein [Campylobacterota bacterium]